MHENANRNSSATCNPFLSASNISRGISSSAEGHRKDQRQIMRYRLRAGMPIIILLAARFCIVAAAKPFHSLRSGRSFAAPPCAPTVFRRSGKMPVSGGSATAVAARETTSRAQGITSCDSDADKIAMQIAPGRVPVMYVFPAPNSIGRREG